MPARPISAPQLKRLQTLWGLLASQARIDARDREARLGWAGRAVGRQITSFLELTLEEAARAIQEMQKQLPEDNVTRRRPGRRLAREYGTAGRRGAVRDAVAMVDQRTLGLIDSLIRQLGWTRERLDGFLRASKSPTQGRQIRTLADANRVIWALKGMLRRVAAPAQRPIGAEKEATL
jgi:hypothetical protein